MRALAFTLILFGFANSWATSENDFGPITPPEIIKEELNNALSAPDQCRQGEFAQEDSLRQIDNGGLNLLRSSETTLASKSELPTQWKMKIIEDIIDYGTEPKQRRIEGIYCMNKTTFKNEECTENLSKPFSSNLAIFSVQNKLTSIFANTETVTYHNFKKEMTQEAPPMAVQNKDNCLNIPDCKINVTNITFDKVIWEVNKEPKKSTINLKLSKEVPYFAGVLERCIQEKFLNLPPDDGILNVKYCDVIKDFQFGAKSN
jgi:hypothetical protein